MTSAAPSVFAIPELLESILANIDDFYELFKMQRVSRTFQTTIDRSISLRRKMGLLARDMPKVSLRKGKRHSSIRSTLFYGMKVKADEPYIEALEDPELIGKVGPGLGPGPLPWERDDYTHGFMLGFLLRPGSTDDKYLLDSSFKLGYTRDHEKDGATHPYGSWRSIRISLVQKPVHVGVYVRVPRTICKKKGIEGQFLYWEIRHYENGEVTLGEIVDRLEEVRSRTYEEHFQKWEGPDKCHMKQPCRGRFDDDDDSDDDESNGAEHDGDSLGGDDRDEGDQLEGDEDGDEAEEVEGSKQTQGPADDTLFW